MIIRYTKMINLKIVQCHLQLGFHSNFDFCYCNCTPPHTSCQLEPAVRRHSEVEIFISSLMDAMCGT